MKRKYLILLNVFYFVSILLIFVLGPYYLNFSPENFENWEAPIYLPSRRLDFSLQQEYFLLNSTFLDWYSEVRVDYNTSQPIYILIIEDSPVPIFQNSTFNNENGVFLSRIAAPANYVIQARGFEGTADVRVSFRLSIVNRTSPYALWGQIMFYGGIGLLIVSVGGIIISWLRKGRPQPKQPLKKPLSGNLPKKWKIRNHLKVGI